MSSERLGLIEDRGSPPSGVLISLLVHAAIIIALIAFHSQAPQEDQKSLEYVDLVRPPVVTSATPPESLPVTDAPGPEVDHANPRAPLSDANRVASAPSPTGPEATASPGPGSGLAPPGTPDFGQQEAPRADPSRNDQKPSDPSPSTPSVDWNQAIRSVTPPAPRTGGDSGAFGGDDGFAINGPVSFETQWYPWGDYSVAMIRKIRNYWYQNMPDLIRLGVQGNVVIRFTIQRSGEITNIEMLRSSGSPPYDFAARKAIELSSFLPKLPPDFPGDSERVTVSFFYNMEPPAR